MCSSTVYKYTIICMYGHIDITVCRHRTVGIQTCRHLVCTVDIQINVDAVWKRELAWVPPTCVAKIFSTLHYRSLPALLSSTDGVLATLYAHLQHFKSTTQSSNKQAIQAMAYTTAASMYISWGRLSLCFDGPFRPWHIPQLHPCIYLGENSRCVLMERCQGAPFGPLCVGQCFALHHWSDVCCVCVYFVVVVVVCCDVGAGRGLVCGVCTYTCMYGSVIINIPLCVRGGV